MRTAFRFAALILAAAAIAAMLPELHSTRSNTLFITETDMKQDSYPELWKKVQEAINEGKPRTALDVVEIIYKKAKTDKNQVQLVKAVSYRVALRAETNEDGEVILVQDIEREVLTAEQPAKAIFLSMLGQLYWSYYQEHQWEISSRTVTADEAGDDLRTWDARKFFETAKARYLASLEPAALLQKVRLKDVQELLVNGEDGDVYRSSLYDILAHRAVDFFADGRANLPKPTREFEAATLDALAPAARFAEHRFDTPDSSDNHWIALSLYQHLVAAHLKDETPDALVDLDLDRLDFTRRITYHDDKDTAFAEALERIATTYRAHAISAEAGARVARYAFERGDYVAALARCDAEIARHPGSRGARNCASLRSEILAKEVDFSVEQTAAPDAPMLAAVQYRNIDRVYCRILPWQNDENDDPRRSITDDERMRLLLSRKTLKAWTASLPDAKDYKGHVVDSKVPGMPLGSYVLVMSVREDFAVGSNRFAVGTLRVTGLSMQSQQLTDCTQLFWVRDAESGAPLPGTLVKLFQRRWNSNGYRYEKIPFRDLTADKNGKAALEPDSRRDYLFATLERGRDVFEVEDGFYPCSRSAPEARLRTIFFTDRGLYRPGQTVFFKGLVVRFDADQIGRAAAKGVSSTVDFLDANYQKISSQNYVSNEYGSFQGSVTVPTGVLTGAMTLRSQHGSVQIQVEEYKRPKFEVTFESAKGTYKLYDQITVKGLAKSFAGANIDGAAVKYRVLRRARYPFWCWWWWDTPRSDEKEIAHGEAKTKDDGSFEISFPALPDKAVRKNTLPVFSYEVSADVIDMSGETRSGSTSVSVGYTATLLSANLPGTLDVSEKAKAVIATTNLNGAPIAARGNAVLELLRPPARVLRERLLPKPDQFAMSRDEFKSAFPYDVWKDENVEDNWPVDDVTLRQEFSTGKDGVDSLALRGLAPGRYRLTLTLKDPSGETITVKQFFTAYSASSSRPAVTEASTLISVKTVCQPGEKATVIFGTALQDAKVLYQVERRGVITEERWITMSNEQRAFTLPVQEGDRGGFSVRFSLLRNRRHYTEETFIAVPWSNKELKITTSVFRDKMLPGSKEEWRLTIKGEKADAVAAEMVAAMYDASLDAIHGHGWESLGWPSWYGGARLSTHAFNAVTAQMHDFSMNPSVSGSSPTYPRLNLFLLDDGGWRYRGRRNRQMAKSGGAMNEAMAAPMALQRGSRGDETMISAERALVDKSERDEKKKDGEALPPPPPGTPRADKPKEDVSGVKARTNFNETAFFFPQLRTDETGGVTLSFTMPEALTRWRLMAFAHTPDMKTGMMQKFAVTQKDLMVVPNAPRFLREGDEIVFPVKITNLSDRDLSGSAKLMIFDALTMQPLDVAFQLANADRNFSIAKGLSTSVNWKLKVPDGLSAIVYRVVAKAGDFSDGEEAPLPVLPNRMLVTESMPLNVRGNQTRTYSFDKLVNSASSKTLRHQGLTLEMTSHPAWYAVQALPYLQEFPYECSEQSFNRLYANSIAQHLVNSSPKIKRVFEQWKGTDALVSNLEKNQELKSLLLQETPWVMQGKDESERKKRIALLFDLNTMSNNLESALRRLEKAQGSNGGFPWFPGMPESRYITQYIVAGFGHLRELGIDVAAPRISAMLRRAVSYCDQDMRYSYERLKATPGFNPKLDHLGYLEIQYLYARSFFLTQEVPKECNEALEYWKEQTRRYWLGKGLMCEAQLSLAMHRFGDKKLPMAIIASLRERALQSDELGMYWKQAGGWWWYQAPIETQAVLVEAFDEVAGDKLSVEEMKIWLLKQKQVQDWRTTVATADACYALLRRGMDLISSDKLVEVSLGGKNVTPVKGDGTNVEAGTGYYKLSWNRNEVKPDMGKVTVKKSDAGIAWGCVYWQYFEQLDKITPAKTPLSIEKKLYKQVNTDAGVMLEPITAASPLRVGDVLKTRVEIRVDRDMEYVHLKDMRGAGFDLINQLSTYRWQGRLGYYEAPKDASVNFFIYWLPKGVHVFEYALRVSHEGVFSNGISTIQCMYAPEFAAHTQGFVVTVK